MASSKTLMLFGLLLAIFLISAEVADVTARDLAEATETQESVPLDGYHHHHGGHYGGHHGGHHGSYVHDQYEDGHHHCHGHHCGGCHGHHCGHH